MRETELWRRLEHMLGPGYARTWAATVALSDLGSLTIVEAIESHVAFRAIWDAVCNVLEVPTSER